MDNLFLLMVKFVAAGGSVTTIMLLYQVFRIEPRLRSLENTLLQGQQVDLLKLTRDLADRPELHERAVALLQSVQEKQKEIK